ncbi:MAG: hypothetical protein ACI92I_000390 [Acidimicrobiales bacterium]|jgi:hypothetical protein
MDTLHRTSLAHEFRISWAVCVICFFLFLPVTSRAAIVINEVAWMGTEVSANDEWIELYNTGSESVSVDGWEMSDGVNFEVGLAGSVASGQYAVLERTDDTSAQGTAFMIYTGVLPNAGATLSLYRTDGALEDRVAGGEDWQNIGGDNATKETAQYTIGGWITAIGTPGFTNTEGVGATPAVEENNNTVEDEDSSSKEAPSLYLSPRELQLDIVSVLQVYVTQEVSFLAQPSGLADGILNSLSYDWNFGDFNTDTGKEATHRFEYPGEYVVTLHSQYKQYESDTRKIVVVLPVSFSLTINTKGDVQVHNDARYEVDVSGYTIIAGKTLQFPKGTILLPNGTITIPKEKLQYDGSGLVQLRDDMKTVIASLSPSVVPVAPEVAQDTASHILLPVAYTPHIEPITSQTKDFVFTGDSPKETGERVIPDSDPEEISQSATRIEAADTVPESMLPYFALLAVIALGVLTIFASKVKT